MKTILNSCFQISPHHGPNFFCGSLFRLLLRPGRDHHHLEHFFHSSFQNSIPLRPLLDQLLSGSSRRLRNRIGLLKHFFERVRRLNSRLLILPALRQPTIFGSSSLSFLLRLVHSIYQLSPGQTVRQRRNIGCFSNFFRPRAQTIEHARRPLRHRLARVAADVQARQHLTHDAFFFLEVAK